MPESRWMTTADVCRHLGITRPTLYAWMNADHDPLPCHQPNGRNGRRMFDRDEVDTWLRSRCSDPAAGEAVA